MTIDELKLDLQEFRSMSAPPELGARILSAAGVKDVRAQISSPIGPIWVVCNYRGLRSVTPVGAAPPTALDGPLPRGLERRLELALQGRKTRLDFDLSGLGSFERSVLSKTQEIPFGEVRSYGWVAKEIDRPRAVRAVGTALAHNPIPLFIPCHRVIRSNWSIGQYSGGGPEAKRSLLTFEGVEIDLMQQLGRRGVRVIADPRSGLFCVPGCRQLKRQHSSRLLEMETSLRALSAGFEACPLCRPA
ncbi:MAG TPA: methylated-DNA--[protein]-cysteine S-methyltransferase [Candidatus Acidoferrales bacterium]|nr:methylated-DNA--[protein]-cysteine S-methyltransferase [Candidatus Acidoferrales bacterium]